MIDDARILSLLEAIRQLAMLPYPFPDAPHGRDPHLVMALGEIAGRSGRAIEEYRARHPETPP